MTNIWNAARNGQIDVIKKLLAEGVDINSQNSKGWSALMYASKYSNTESSLETVKLLIDSRADLNLKDNDGWTALLFASRYSNTTSSLETVKLLIDSGADLNLQNSKGWTALIAASRYSNTESSVETVKLLIDSGADSNLQNITGYTALMLASKHSTTTSSLETVKSLIDSGADLNLQDNDGWTALMVASYYSNNNSSLETVKLLVNAGADVNLQKINGLTALSFANDLQTVKILLDAGANPFVNTTAMRCQTEECLRVVETFAWKLLFKRDLQTAEVLGKSILNKEVWQIILLNERQRRLCTNLNSNKNKYVLEAFAIQLGADPQKVRDMSKAQLCGLISRSIDRSNLAYKSDIEMAKRELEKRKDQIKNLARKFNIDTDRPIEQIIADISKIF